MDAKGDPEKQTEECKRLGYMRCPNMKETYGGFDGERYRCEQCGESYYLDYDEMR